MLSWTPHPAFKSHGHWMRSIDGRFPAWNPVEITPAGQPFAARPRVTPCVCGLARAVARGGVAPEEPMEAARPEPRCAQAAPMPYNSCPRHDDEGEGNSG